MTRPRDPATIGRRRFRVPTAVLAAPFELAFACLFLIIGAGLLIHGHEIKVTTVQRLPVPLVVGWEVCLLAGGPAIGVGLMWRGTQTMARALERAGLYLGMAAWSTYALTVAALAPGASAVPVGQGATVAIACLLRAAALQRIDRAVEAARDGVTS